MQYICDATPNTWFRLETVAEAQAESRLMEHAVERYFRDAHEKAAKSYVPPVGGRYIEQSIGRKDFVQRTTPLFLTLRNNEGTPLVTAMLPPSGKPQVAFRPIVVGKSNSDPYPAYGTAIKALSVHLGLALDRERCFPYQGRG